MSRQASNPTIEPVGAVPLYFSTGDAKPQTARANWSRYLDALFELAKVAEGRQVTVPLQQTFWAKAFGAVDRFGIPWAVNCGEREGA